MEKAAGPAGELRFEFSPTELVSVRDVLEYVSDLPIQRGLDIQVTLEADDLDDAGLARAIAAAESSVILRSGAARAPTGDALFRIAYEITPGANDRAFLQHLPV